MEEREREKGKHTHPLSLSLSLSHTHTHTHTHTFLRLTIEYHIVYGLFCILFILKPHPILVINLFLKTQDSTDTEMEQPYYGLYLFTTAVLRTVLIYNGRITDCTLLYLFEYPL